MMEVEYAAQRILTVLRRRQAFAAFPAGNAWQVRLLRYLPLPVADWLANQLLQRSRLK